MLNIDGIDRATGASMVIVMMWRNLANGIASDHWLHRGSTVLRDRTIISHANHP